MQVEVVGGASGKSFTLNYQSEDLPDTMLHFLRKKGVTIASSCEGEGVCKRCDIQNGWLTCRLTLETFLERQPDGKIFISYL